MITLGQNDQAFLLSMNLTVYNMNKRKPQSLRGDTLARRMVQLVYCAMDCYFTGTYVYWWILYVQKIFKTIT